jgi:hypothetical protein
MLVPRVTQSKIRIEFCRGAGNFTEKKRGGPEHGIRRTRYADLALTDQVERHCYVVAFSIGLVERRE